MKSYFFHAPISRRMPDPVFPNASRHIMFCRAIDTPLHLPLDPNPRKQNLDRQVYKTVKRSLRNMEGEPNTFHLKNRGITIIAERVIKVDEGKYLVTIGDGFGIIDGGHTDKVIEDAIELLECPDTQYLKFEILTGIPVDLVDEIAGGLNTSVQVQEKSLANQRGQFDWIKIALRGHSGADDIAYMENDEGLYEIRAIVSILTLFNIDIYSNEAPVQDYPIGAYSGKEKTLEQYLNDESDSRSRSFRKLEPILIDILVLWETISSEARDRHNQQNRGSGGKLSFIETRETGFSFPFLDATGQYRLRDGALIPALGAFRYLVVRDETSGKFRWRCASGFDGVLEVWECAAGEMMRTLQSTCADLKWNVNALGKNRGLWSNLYNIVKAKALELGQLAP